MLTALSLAILWLSSVVPTARLSAAALAGLLPAAALISAGGLPAGLLCYAGTAALSLLLLPDKIPALFYVLLFGHYPVLKCVIERIRSLPLEWLLKLLLCNALFALLSLFFRGLLPFAFSRGAFVFFLAGNAAFVAYDRAFSGLIGLYARRIGRNL